MGRGFSPEALLVLLSCTASGLQPIAVKLSGFEVCPINLLSLIWLILHERLERSLLAAHARAVRDSRSIRVRSDFSLRFCCVAAS